MHLPSQWVDPLLKCTSLLPTIQHSTRHFIGKVTTFSLDYVFSLVSGSKKRICVKITESETDLCSPETETRPGGGGGGGGIRR